MVFEGFLSHCMVWDLLVGRTSGSPMTGRSSQDPPIVSPCFFKFCGLSHSLFSI